jgi:pyruvate dehydrogenase E1 component alpha subunit
VYQTAQRLVDRARNAGGPAFLLCNTYRYRGHHVGDISREYYRPKTEEQHWMADRDPIKILTDWLVAEQLATRGVLDGIQAELTSKMDAAVASAIAAPFPTPDEVDQDVYA